MKRTEFDVWRDINRDFSVTFSDDRVKLYTSKKRFNGYTYVVEFGVFKNKVYISASSGKKRKELVVFEDKPNKSAGGLSALLWIKEAVVNSEEYWKTFTPEVTHLVVGWSDNRRKEIYKRGLEPFGYRVGRIDGVPCLIKKL